MAIDLIKHQIEPSEILFQFLTNSGTYAANPENNTGVLILGQTGVGKTYVIAHALKRAQDKGFFRNTEDKPLKMFSVFLVTPRKAIIQQKRVFYKAGIKDFDVVSPSAFSSSFGAMFISWVKPERENRDDDFAELPVWDEDTKPDVIFVDEVQLFKSKTSKRAEIIRQARTQKIKLVFLSATPFQKACEAKTIVYGCNLIRNANDFNRYANLVSPGGPELNSPLAVRRIKKDLLSHNALISIKGAKYPFKPIIRNVLLDLTPEQQKIYDASEDEYFKVLAEQGRHGPVGIMKIWVVQNKHRETTDLLKAPALAKRAFQVANNPDNPRQVIIGSNFVAALEMIWNQLVNVHKVPTNKISVLFGGQTDEQAQKSIDDFQAGITDYFLTTLKSGGQSISLHHETDTARPRYVLLPPTWSIYEMVQLLGRAQRITSRSQTIQEIVWYRNTIEEKVSETLDDKFDCIRELAERRDSFLFDVYLTKAKPFIGEAERELLKEEANKTTTKDNDDEEETEEIDLGFLGDDKNEDDLGENV